LVINVVDEQLKSVITFKWDGWRSFVTISRQTSREFDDGSTLYASVGIVHCARLARWIACGLRMRQTTGARWRQRRILAAATIRWDSVLSLFTCWTLNSQLSDDRISQTLLKHWYVPPSKYLNIFSMPCTLCCRLQKKF